MQSYPFLSKKLPWECFNIGEFRNFNATSEKTLNVLYPCVHNHSETFNFKYMKTAFKKLLLVFPCGNIMGSDSILQKMLVSY